MRKAFKAAFPHTVPVLLGYLFVGLAFGILFQKMGYGVWWAILVSFAIYAGAGQFVALNFFAGGFGLLEVALMTFMVNVRYMFYGISFIDRFRQMKDRRPYLIYTLTDETYSLLCSVKAPEDVSDADFCLAIAMLDQCYWVTGGIVGSLVGDLLTFNTAGIDFAMTAMFIVIFVEQWESMSTHLPAVVGVVGSIGALLLFGAEKMALVSMIVIVVALVALRGPIEKAMENAKPKAEEGEVEV